VSNKFNILWQIVRTKARKIKDPEQKIKYVLDFLFAHKNVHNKDRVENWLRMTAVSYKEPAVREMFQQALSEVDAKEYDTVDTDKDLKDVSTNDLLLVYNDLKKRKYGFQFKAVPIAHTIFMTQLEEELKKRNLL